ncbi:MAG: hypothetical protein IPP90_23020 [Gemmatimonadaceae bacterium]|nr:hypothetical protein [Gemmatimonadaceae bacterium]
MSTSPDSNPQKRSVTLLRVAGATVGIALLAAVFAVGARYGADRVRARDEWIGGQLLSTAIDSVRANALDSLPSEELIRRAVSGMLREAARSARRAAPAGRVQELSRRIAG